MRELSADEAEPGEVEAEDAHDQMDEDDRDGGAAEATDDVEGNGGGRRQQAVNLEILQWQRKRRSRNTVAHHANGKTVLTRTEEVTLIDAKVKGRGAGGAAQKLHGRSLKGGGSHGDMAFETDVVVKRKLAKAVKAQQDASADVAPKHTVQTNQNHAKHTNGHKSPHAVSRGRNGKTDSVVKSHDSRRGGHANGDVHRTAGPGGGGVGGGKTCSDPSDSAHQIVLDRRYYQQLDLIPEMPKVQLYLTRTEKEDDFAAIKGEGTKLSQRPRRRPKQVEKGLQRVHPGGWLPSVTRERYEVRERKTMKKAPRGLKAMERMDSDSD
jgi:hypothetical protein